MARNHPFVDGNKRTAHVSYRTFLAMNGAELLASDEEKYLSMLSLAEGNLPEADFAAWLRAHLRGGAAGEVNEPRVAYETPKRARKPAARRIAAAR